MRANPLTCEQALAKLDLFLDGMMDTDGEFAMESHLGECAACRAECELRDRVRLRLRQALRKPVATPEFENRVRTMVRKEAVRRFRFGWQAMAAAAALLVGLSGVAAYELGYVHWSSEQESSYLASASGSVSRMMRVGLVDHVHCALFRKWPPQTPAMTELVNGLAPQYQPIAGLVQQKLPANFKILMAHQCRTHGRRYIHLAMRSGDGKLVSLVISRKQEGENMQSDGIRNESTRQLQLAGFESGNYVAFLISDMGAAENQQLAQAIAVPVKSFLNTLG